MTPDDHLIPDLLGLTPRPVSDAYDEWRSRGKPLLVTTHDYFDTQRSFASVVALSPFWKQAGKVERKWWVW